MLATFRQQARLLPRLRSGGIITGKLLANHIGDDPIIAEIEKVAGHGNPMLGKPLEV